jgi:preprotein translocase subunit YajC
MLLLATTSKGSSSFIIVIYFVIFGLFYFFYLRPRSKKQKAARTQARQVEVGERAQTIGGFVGTITKRTDDLVTLRADSGAELDFIPTAIARRIDPVVAPSVDDKATEEGHDH